MPLTNETAKRMIEASENTARQLGIAIGTAILDGEGRLFAFSRMDGAYWATVEGSQAKAFAAVLFRRNGPELQQVAQTTLTVLSVVHERGILPLPSATVVREGERVIAAIGCSGAPSDELDAACADAARDVVTT